MSSTDKPGPAIVVIFGITGDLVKRKLFPALYGLIKAGLVDDNTKIIGITRQDLSTEAVLSDLIADYPEYDERSLKFLKDRFNVQTMDVNSPDDYRKLLETLNKMEDDLGVCLNRLFYLSIPPQVFGNIVTNLGKSGLNKKCKHDIAESRLLVEKPFGYDLKSAEELIRQTNEYFGEDQVFRIDHYLAKETAQNILSFRFNNAIFESIWEERYVARIEISALETIGIENRANFYDQTGALRDIIQSHLLQLLAIVTMEEPLSFSSNDIHTAKIALLNEINPIKTDVVQDLTFRGQYESYRTEVDKPESITETYAAIKVSIDHPRWKNVPIIIKTGKSLNEKKTEVKVTFKRHDKDEKLTQHNSLTFRIQPNEGIDIGILVKKPGLDNELDLVDMDFSYGKYFPDGSQPDAYERVLIDAIRGDHTLFSTGQEVLAAWKVIEDILKVWAASGDNLKVYQDNSTGPEDLPDWLKEPIKNI
jgi:glucose-6-phosphate 1-dehydrogenase